MSTHNNAGPAASKSFSTRSLIDGFDEFWAERHIKHILNPAGFARMVWTASARHNRKTVLGAMDSTAGFYPVDEGSTPSGQATSLQREAE